MLNFAEPENSFITSVSALDRSVYNVYGIHVHVTS